MEIDLQTIIGATSAEIVARILWGIAGGLLTMFGFWGLRRRVEKLENNQGSQPVLTVNNFIDGNKKFEHAYIDHKTRTMHFGTRHGDLSVCFRDAETAMQDIQSWIICNKLQASPSPEAWRKVIANLHERANQTNEQND